MRDRIFFSRDAREEMIFIEGSRSSKNISLSSDLCETLSKTRYYREDHWQTELRDFIVFLLSVTFITVSILLQKAHFPRNSLVSLFLLHRNWNFLKTFI